MENNYIDLLARVDGYEINWKLSPTPKTLYKEINDFASSICEMCKIIIRNRIASNDSNSHSVGVLIYCELLSVTCYDLCFETNKFLMTSDSFHPELSNFKLELVEKLAAPVIASEKFENQNSF